MLNIRELEQKWIRYKIRTFLPYGILLLSTAVIFGFSWYFFSSKQITQVTQQKKHNPIPFKKEDVQVVIHGATDTKQDTKVVLKPSLNFMRKMQASFDSYYSDEPDNTPYPQHTPTTTKPQTPQIAVKQKNDLQEDKNTKKIVIETKNSMEDIKDAERRFEKNNSPALSLFLARQYYARKQYHKAYNYALITNQLDKEIEDSWLIFSKSLVKLGKKNKAIQALSEYIKYSHSSNAALLLDAIKTGKFQ